MPLFHLHTLCDAELVRDPDGSDLPDLETAREDALGAARDLWAAAILRGQNLSDCRFIIADEGDEQLLVLPFIEALPRTLRERLRP